MLGVQTPVGRVKSTPDPDTFDLRRGIGVGVKGVAGSDAIVAQ